MPRDSLSDYTDRFEAVIRAPTEAAVGALFDPGMVDHAPWPGQSPDLAGFRAGLDEMRAAFPDLSAEVRQTVREGDRLAVHFVLSGTRLGEFMGKAPDGRTFRVEAMDVVRLSEGRIAEHWGVLDAAAMAEQLGL